MRYRLTAVALLSLLGTAQAQPVQNGSADKGKATMGLPAAGTQGANNGVGTQGSINGQNGTASSTVAGTQGGSTPFKTDGGNSGASGPMETDPAQGGGQQKQ